MEKQTQKGGRVSLILNDSRPSIEVAKQRYSKTASWLEDWWAAARKARWSRLVDVRVLYPDADEVGQCLVFNACGNEYRHVSNGDTQPCTCSIQGKKR